MNTLKTLFAVACLIAVACASSNNHHGKSTKPSQWLSASDLESLPSVEEISIQRLESMQPEKGAELINTIYHLSQINHDLTPSYVPSANSIPVSILKPNGQNVSVTLSQLVSTAKQQQGFGNEEVTILMTGVPQTSRSAKKANRKLVQAYMQRYNAQLQAQLRQQHSQNNDYDNDGHGRTSSEEDYNQVSDTDRVQTGDLVVIDFSESLQPYKRAVMLDTEETGNMMGDILVELAEQTDVPEEIIHLIGQGPAAAVAGAAGRRYTRQTGRSIRRITGLDPAKVYARNEKTVTGLARGDADFVDCIHTSPYGMGTTARRCDVDFYPNGPSVAMPGTDNIVESSMRATRYFAESVRPGNERNFPAVPANNLKQYKKNDGQGKRAYMGIDTDYDLEGDYMLEVNAHSPFGKSAKAEQQKNYHNAQSSWKNGHNSHDEDYE